jgi:hypothetical protein
LKYSEPRRHTVFSGDIEHALNGAMIAPLPPIDGNIEENKGHLYQQAGYEDLLEDTFEMDFDCQGVRHYFDLGAVIGWLLDLPGSGPIQDCTPLRVVGRSINKRAPPSREKTAAQPFGAG